MGLAVPANVPEDRISYLQERLEPVISSQGFAETMRKLGLEPFPVVGHEMMEVWRTKSAIHREIADELGRAEGS